MRFVVPEQVVSQFHIRDGDTVADFGAGSGYFTKVLSQAAGSGKVYACDIQKPLLEKVAELARSEQLENVEVVWCDLEEKKGSKVADDTLDVVIMVNTLFQIEDKDTALQEVARVLRKGGKFFVIDWSESFGGMGPQENAVISEEDATRMAEKHGFSLERTYGAGEHHYGLAFRK